MSDKPSDSAFWPADSPAAIAHINLLQGIINRLANNSASCKTWCVTLVGAFLSLAVATRLPVMVAFALVPVVIFGFLDTMYLAQERAYRDLYTRIVKTFCDRTYALDQVFDARASFGFGDFVSALRSWSVFPVYFGLILAYLVANFAGWLSMLSVPAK